ncbi:shK domain-like domain-containing protein [Ditylenchus destructor]|nr:shK domain-like domain-containing protein [Ditylenchus destructor]
MESGRVLRLQTAPTEEQTVDSDRKCVSLWSWAYNQMVSDCPATCNRCPGECVDAGTDCPGRRDWCNVPGYIDLMVWQCPATCGRCGNRPAPTGTVSTGFNQPASNPGFIGLSPFATNNIGTARCQDQADCLSWIRNGFCNNTWYDISVKRERCPIACGTGC